MPAICGDDILVITPSFNVKRYLPYAEALPTGIARATADVLLDQLR